MIIYKQYIYHHILTKYELVKKARAFKDQYPLLHRRCRHAPGPENDNNTMQIKRRLSRNLL